MRCRNCNTKVEKGQKFCTSCGQPIHKNFSACDFIIAITLCCIIGWFFLNVQLDKIEEREREIAMTEQQFSGECPIEVVAKVEDNLIGYPELRCTIKNNTDKDIIAYKLYFVPKDVYGEERINWKTTNKLVNDDLLKAGTSSKGSWALLDNLIKKGDLYVYSVTFDDGTSWGDKDAYSTDILKYGKSISVSFEK